MKNDVAAVILTGLVKKKKASSPSETRTRLEFTALTHTTRMPTQDESPLWNGCGFRFYLTMMSVNSKLEQKMNKLCLGCNSNAENDNTTFLAQRNPWSKDKICII